MVKLLFGLNQNSLDFCVVVFYISEVLSRIYQEFSLWINCLTMLYLLDSNVYTYIPGKE